jgi:hypothetical protein
MTSIKVAPTVAFGLVLGLAALVPAGPAHAHGPANPGPAWPFYYYPTQYQQGSLLVEITGPLFGTLEAYYKDLAYREEIAGANNLHVHRVHLSPGDDGLFVTIYGANNDHFVAIGWTSTGPLKITGDSTAGGVALRSRLPGHGPIHASWKSERVVRLSSYDQYSEYTCVLRWNATGHRWQILNEQTSQWSDVTP